MAAEEWLPSGPYKLVRGHALGRLCGAIMAWGVFGAIVLVMGQQAKDRVAALLQDGRIAGASVRREIAATWQSRSGVPTRSWKEQVFDWLLPTFQGTASADLGGESKSLDVALPLLWSRLESLPPLALVGDQGGGGLWLAYGIVCALLEANRSGHGQVVDAAIIDGVSSMLTPMHGRFEAGSVGQTRGDNANDGSRPWYCAYETKDRKWVAVGAIESRFYAELLRKLGLDREDLPKQHDAAGWPRLHERFADVFRQKTRDEWMAIMEGSDACVAPVLDLGELRNHPHARARAMFQEFDGVTHPAPGPRMSRTAPEIQSGPAQTGADTEPALTDWGFTAAEISALKKSGAIG